MTALVYFIVAVVAAVLSLRAWLADREDSGRIAFLGLGWCVALAYGSFALSLLPGLYPLRAVHMAAACLIPAFLVWVIDRHFDRQRTSRPQVRRMFWAGFTIAPTATVLHVVFFLDTRGISPPEAVAGLFAVFCLAWALWRLWVVHELTALKVDKVRLRYLLGVTAAAGAVSVAEQLARGMWPPSHDLSTVSLTSRAVELQGPLPPLAALLTGVALYFLYHSLVMYRLLDLYEAFSRLAALLLSALALVLVDGITVMWVDTFTDYPFHSTFQVFIASVLFLAAYDPLKDHVSWWSNRLLNRRGQQLAETIASARSALSTVISTEGLTETLLTHLHASGRVPACSVYLWDQGLDAYALAGSRGTTGDELLAAVAARPFTDQFADGSPWYLKASLARRARTDSTAADVVTLMDAMQADLTLPFVSGSVVLGWMSLRDEDWSDGFSADEILRLQDVAYLATVVLSNIQDFQALEEEHRLAALGAMAAGLAHEIRNPLAGIKGAAQYLQHEALPDDAQEMLNVVVDETDRLNLVVSQFLDYARPFEIQLAPDHINAVVSQVLALLRAQGIPEGIEIRENLAGDLPAFDMDRARLNQVLLNLFQNALHAMPDGGTLTAATRRRVNRSGRPVVEVVVSDTGVGIDNATLEQLFIPFFTTRPDGTGLGLAICQRIVQAHGGEIDVQSTPGRGSTFVIRLPLPAFDVASSSDEAAK